MRSIVLFRVSRHCVGLYEWGGVPYSLVVNSVILAEQSAVCVYVGKSYIDEHLVGTVILPQIGELPVHPSIGEVSL